MLPPAAEPVCVKRVRQSVPSLAQCACAVQAWQESEVEVPWLNVPELK